MGFGRGSFKKRNAGMTARTHLGSSMSGTSPRELTLSLSDSSDDDSFIKFETFQFYDSDKLGKGSSSLVFEGTFFDGQKVAIKRIQKAEAKVRMEEYKILSTTSHPNIVKNMQIDKDKYFIYLVLELCHTNLDKMVDSIRDYTIKVKLLYDIALGLDHLHSKKIIHRDLKPSNILIKKNSVSKQIIPKIADFGISRKLDVGKDHYTATEGRHGTLIWCAPEVSGNNNRHITTAIDMFAYGCIVHFIMCPVSRNELRHPFGVMKGDIGGDDIIRAIRAGRRKLYISSIAYKNPKPIDKVKRMISDILVQDLTNLNPGNRPSIKHVLNFPLFWDSSKQCSFFPDVYNYMNIYHEEEFEKNCIIFFSHRKLNRLCKEPDGWKSLSKQLNEVGLKVPKANDTGVSYFTVLRILRNKITHCLEKKSGNKSSVEIPIDSMLTKFNQQLPFFFPTLWVTYRYLQIPSRYPVKLEMVKTKLETYYVPVDVGDPFCLATDFGFIKE